MHLYSPAFVQGAPIPAKYTCEGQNVSPPLRWDHEPKRTESFAILCEDPDAPGKVWVHWVVYNLPKVIHELHEGVAPHLNVLDGAHQGRNDFLSIGYGGPCPPQGTHHYHFKLYALDSRLELPAGATKEQLLSAIHGHVVDQAELVGTYRR